MMESINKNKDTILLIIVIVLAAWNIFTTNGVKTDVKSYKQKIESLQVQIDSTQSVNKEIDEKVTGVKENVTAITKEIHHIDNNLTVVKQKTNEKVISVELIGNVELERLFTERYGN